MKRTRKCTFPGCKEKHFAIDLCKLHYSRWRKGYPMDMPYQEHIPLISQPCDHYPKYGKLDCCKRCYMTQAQRRYRLLKKYPGANIYHGSFAPIRKFLPKS